MKKLFVTAVLVAVASFGAAADAAFTWTPGQGILKAGSPYSMQVVELQKCLAELGNNPAYNVDGLYGPVTASAVRSFQANYNLQNPGAPIYVDGIIGDQTGPLYVAACADADMDDEDMDDEDDSDDNDGELSGGEASLEDFDLSSEDDAEEGKAMHVATIEFDVEDADAMIDRLDLTFSNASVGGTADDEPWDVFETITLAVDGDEIAEEQVDDEDDWSKDDQPFEFRFTGLDYIVEEDETAEIEIWVTAQDNVDDVANADWIIYVDDEGIRAVDSEGIQNYIGKTSDTVAFNIDAEGGDEDITIRTSSDDPDASTLEVDADNDSDWYEVFVFELESDENDIDIETLEFGVITTGGNYADIVDDIYVEIDGDEFDDVTEDLTDADDAQLTFDIDKDATVDADEEVTVSVWMKFKQATQGKTVQVDVDAVYGEGVDDVEDTTGVSGETHTLALAVAEIDATSSVSANDPNTSGVISWEITVDARDADEDITFDVADNADVDGSTDDVEFTVSGKTPALAVSTLTLISGDATFNAGTWTVLKGDDAVFALDTSIDTTADTAPGTAADGGVYRVRLDAVAGVTVDEISSGMSLSEA